MSVILTPGKAGLAELEAIWRSGAPVALDPAAVGAVTAAAALVAQAAAGETAVYGVNTGFGKLASVKIAARDTATLQRNLILSHCCGVGEALDVATTRLMMVLKMLSLGRGASGVRWAIIAQLEAMLAAGVTPVIPVQGSVGASGDLAPLAHMAAAMIGEGEARIGAEVMPGAAALAKAGLSPVVLGPKEGLALINGTQFSTACALAGLWDAQRAAAGSVVTASLTTDAIMGSTAPLHPAIHGLRGHPGQIAVAAAMRQLMEGSQIRESHRDGDTRVQDPYCIRCQPQVTGAAIDLLAFAARTLGIEANAVTDNPLVLVDAGLIVSGGNFHAEPVAFAADQIALAIAEIGAIAQRRVALMVDPTLSFDLPPFLTPEPGLNSGLMIAEVTTAALMSENKHLANPCSTDSTPTSANQEDHVSMAAHAARRLRKMNANLAVILGVELICAAQGIEFRAPLQTSPALQAALARIRADIPTLGQDRYLAPDITAAASLISDGGLIDAAGVVLCNPVEVTRGNGPIVLGLPHTGTHVDAAIGVLLNRNGRELADTDWHIDRLYNGLRADVTTVRATFHRYVIDANRDPEGQSLYPGQNTTGLVPATDFEGKAIWDRPITDAETQARLAQYHVPYHSALQAEMERVRALHGVAILFDAHSIRSQIPFLFNGLLPDLNLGTNDGMSCDPILAQAVAAAIDTPGYTSVVNGRFKGGWSTRHYGRPHEGWHALQLEIAQSAYLEAEAPPWHYDSEKAARLRSILADCLNMINDLSTTLKVTS